jgi:AcrR family transcriptional regulator
MNTSTRRKKGEQTRITVIEAARKLLLEEGYGNFVFRKVAKSAGVEPGNVQYYFASKRDLLWAVLEPELENYEDRLLNASHKGHSKTEKIAEIVNFLIRDITSNDTLLLWLPIWAMAAHDKEISKMISAWYRSYIKTLSSILQDALPDISREHADESAVLITAQFDGLMVMLCLGKPRKDTVARLKKNLSETISRIINGNQYK